MTRAFLLVLLLPTTVWAQATGSRFGGSAWGSTSSSSSSSSTTTSTPSYSPSTPTPSYTSTSDSTSWGSTDTSTSTDTDTDTWSSSRRSSSYRMVTPEENERKFWINTAIQLVALLAIGIVLARTRRPKWFRVIHYPPADVPAAFVHRPVEELVDVSALSIAFDSRARKAIQEQLALLAVGGYRSGASGHTRVELAKLLRQTANVLKQHKVAWLYAGGRDVPPANPQAARERFNEMVADLRARYRHEVLSNVDGELERRDAPDQRPRAEEGWGVVVVSLVVAARGDLLGLRSATDAHSVELHLERLANAGLELQAFEAIWSPSKDGDRMSSLELEAIYPELEQLDEASIVGRVFCDHCAAPYTAELGSCPSCGAPRAPV